MVKTVWSSSCYFSESSNWAQSMLLPAWGFLFHLIPAVTFYSTCKQLLKLTLLHEVNLFQHIYNSSHSPCSSMDPSFFCMLLQVFIIDYILFCVNCVTSLYIHHIPVTPCLSQLNILSTVMGTCVSFLCLSVWSTYTNLDMNLALISFGFPLTSI